MGFANFTFRDYGNEVSNVRVRQTTLTAANFDAQATLRGAFASALVNMTLVTPVNGFTYGNEQVNSVEGASNQYAQRESKWLVQYHETGGTKKYSFEIPCADLTLLDPDDKAHANLGDAGTVDAFKTAAEAFVLGPNGVSIVIDEITHVGRNT